MDYLVRDVSILWFRLSWDGWWRFFLQIYNEVDVKIVFKEVTSKFLRRRIVEVWSSHFPIAFAWAMYFCFFSSFQRMNQNNWWLVQIRYDIWCFFISVSFLFTYNREVRGAMGALHMKYVLLIQNVVYYLVHMAVLFSHVGKHRCAYLACFFLLFAFCWRVVWLNVLYTCYIRSAMKFYFEEKNQKLFQTNSFVFQTFNTWFLSLSMS